MAGRPGPWPQPGWTEGLRRPRLSHKFLIPGPVGRGSGGAGRRGARRFPAPHEDLNPRRQPEGGAAAALPLPPGGIRSQCLTCSGSPGS